MAYGTLIALVCKNHKINSKVSVKTEMITLLACLIFGLHQMQAYVKIDPLTNVQKQALFRCESLLQLHSFIVTIGTFLPIKYYLPPVLIIYTGVYGLTYYHQE